MTAGMLSPCASVSAPVVLVSAGTSSKQSSLTGSVCSSRGHSPQLPLSQTKGCITVGEWRRRNNKGLQNDSIHTPHPQPCQGHPSKAGFGSP